MDGMALVAMLFKNEQTGYEVWFPDIPMDEPLLRNFSANTRPADAVFLGMQRI